VEVEQTCIASGGFVFRFRFRYRLVLVVLSVHERNRFLLWTIAMDELAGRVLNCGWIFLVLMMINRVIALLKVTVHRYLIGIISIYSLDNELTDA
jgi:hypothetical protein